MSIAETADLWWKNAVIYCLDVQTFFDSDGDGIGDFAGLTEKVDYLAGLGVTCIWLMPIYPTADRDDGYDISEHYGIDTRLGSFGDFTEFVRTARDRGMRVIVDLVVNHTSDQHPWFQSARRSRESRFRDFYVWRDEVPDDGPQGEVFPGRQGGIWSYDTEAGQYYLHRFYRHQPDLNIAAAEVRDEIRKLIGFWLTQNLSGFRVDAVPFLLEIDGIGEEMELDPHDYLRDLRAYLARRSGEAILLGEVNLPAEEQRRFFGDEDGDELHLLFDFLIMQATYLAIARGDAEPIVRSPARAAVDTAGGGLGDIPAQPRRADARQTERRRAGRSVRRLRPGSGNAALRAGIAAAAAHDARQRPALDPHGLQPDVLAARDADAVLWRGDRDGREPRRRRTVGRAHPDAVDRR